MGLLVGVVVVGRGSRGGGVMLRVGRGSPVQRFATPPRNRMGYGLLQEKKLAA